MINDFDALYPSFARNGTGIITMTTVQLAAQSVKNHFNKQSAEKDAEIASLKAENERLKSEDWMKKAAHKIYMDGMRGEDELDYQEQTADFVKWMKEAQLNSAEPLDEK